MFILKNMVLANPHAHKDIIKTICEILMKIVDHRYPHEFDYHRIPAPWQQIDILKML
jgi:AP-4 complex subunit epsilon-1